MPVASVLTLILSPATAALPPECPPPSLFRALLPPQIPPSALICLSLPLSQMQPAVPRIQSTRYVTFWAHSIALLDLHHLGGQYHGEDWPQKHSTRRPPSKVLIVDNKHRNLGQHVGGKVDPSLGPVVKDRGWLGRGDNMSRGRTKIRWKAGEPWAE